MDGRVRVPSSSRMHKQFFCHMFSGIAAKRHQITISHTYRLFRRVFASFLLASSHCLSRLLNAFLLYSGLQLPLAGGGLVPAVTRQKAESDACLTTTAQPPPAQLGSRLPANCMAVA